MGKTTIRVSEEFRDYVKAHRRDGESIEETLRRLIGGPDPRQVAGLLTPEEAETAKAAVEGLRGRDDGRLERAREAFAEEGASEDNGEDE